MLVCNYYAVLQLCINLQTLTTISAQSRQDVSPLMGEAGCTLLYLIDFGISRRNGEAGVPTLQLNNFLNLS